MLVIEGRTRCILGYPWLVLVVGDLLGPMLQALVHLTESQARRKSPRRPVQSKDSHVVQEELEKLELKVFDIMKGYSRSSTAITFLKRAKHYLYGL